MTQFLPCHHYQHELCKTTASEHTSKKPLMKFLGSCAFGSSSALKYFITCEICFQ